MVAERAELLRARPLLADVRTCSSRRTSRWRAGCSTCALDPETTSGQQRLRRDAGASCARHSVLVQHADVVLRRGPHASDLYYADPRAFFDRCKRTSRGDVALLHDYGLYEFTILVRTEEADSEQRRHLRHRRLRPDRGVVPRRSTARTRSSPSRCTRSSRPPSRAARPTDRPVRGAGAFPPRRVLAMLVAIGFSQVNQARARVCVHGAARLRADHLRQLEGRPTGATRDRRQLLRLRGRTIQPFVTIGNNVDPLERQPHRPPPQIGDHCFIASHVVISGDATIGDDTFVGSTRRSATASPSAANVIGAGARDREGHRGRRRVRRSGDGAAHQAQELGAERLLA